MLMYWYPNLGDIFILALTYFKQYWLSSRNLKGIHEHSKKNPTNPHSYKFIRGYRLPTTLYLYERTQQKSTQELGFIIARRN